MRTNLGRLAGQGYAEWDLDGRGERAEHLAAAVAEVVTGHTGAQAGELTDPDELIVVRHRTPDRPTVRLSRLPGGAARLHCWFDSSDVDAQTHLDAVAAVLRNTPPAEPAPRPARRGGLGSTADAERLADLPAAPDLPTTSRVPAGAHEWVQSTTVLPAAEWAALRDAATERGVPIAGVLVAALAEVLRTWSANDEFTLRLAGQGLLVLTPAGDTVGERIVAAARGDVAEISHAGVDRLFPVTVGPLLIGTGELVEFAVRPPESSLHLQCTQVGGELRCSVGRLDHLFPPGMLDDLNGALDRLLHLLATDPATWAANHVDLVPRHQLVQRQLVNATATRLVERLLHTPVAEHAANTPDALAVYTAHRVLTYRELFARVNQVGNALRADGVVPNQLVAVVMERGWEQIVAAHGVLAAGGAYLPIDPHVPAERLRHILSRAEVGIVLTQSTLLSTVEFPETVRPLAVDTDFDTFPDMPLAPVQQTSDLAYVIYTSGSTGEPKGVMVEHRGVWNTIVDMNRRLHVGPDDRCMMVSGMQFDLSVYDIFGMIAAGGCVVIPDPSPTPDPTHWADIVEASRVTFWNSAPQLFDMLLLHLDSTAERDRVRSLRTVVLAGDWLPLTLPQRLRALTDDVVLYNAGGPAETCVWSIYYPVSDVDPDWASIPYGRPIANQRYHVVDEQLRHQPVWVPGELYVTSEIGLAKGYWRDDVRTKERFVTLPSTGERAYATGDVGRYLPDGNIELLGRTDFQVKIHGVRIELGEIEAVLNRYPGVRAAVVTAAGDGQHLTTLRAHIATGPDGHDEDWRDGLRTFAGGELPQYMLPGVFTFVDELPLSRNGKIDRKALTASPVEQVTRTGVAPRTDLERSLARLWTETLGVEVFAHDDFFALGGHSLRAISLLYRIHDTFGVELELHEFIENPVLALVAEQISRALSGGDDALAILDEVESMSDEDVLALLADR